MRLPGFEKIRPPRPTRRTEYVAERIAQRLVKELNLDDFYWSEDELPDKICQMQQAIIDGVRMSNLIETLDKRHGDWWGSDEMGMEQHCEAIGPGIEQAEVARAVREWSERYEVAEKPA